jgi:serine/threonine protein kinase/tetratricopeptide (TPR) repeat protein
MMNAQWEQVISLFEMALERPPVERDRFLDEATGGDAVLREKVAAMLRADSSPHLLLDSNAGAVWAPAPSPERQFAGRQVGPYTLIREIGRGGMATVYLANDSKHRRSVALKLLHADASSIRSGERFRREIEVVAQLHHPHILPLYDSGEIDGLLYYVMPLVTGETLRDRIARDGALPIDDVRRIMGDLGAALDYAHRRGVVHRDVKPANILVDDAHAAIADFGIAQRGVDGTPQHLTGAGVIIGTPAYMSPEQAIGSTALDARSDVYSLGCVVFEMLTGAPPFQGATAAGVVASHLRDPVPSARAKRPGLAPSVDDTIKKALGKAPERRFDSVREFVSALDDALQTEPLPGTGSFGQPPQRGLPVGRRSLAVASGLILFFAALAAWSLLKPEDVPSIAVLPLVNMSGDAANEYFSDGVTDELTGALAQLGRIRVTARTTAFAYKGKPLNIQRIGEELGVSRILEGSVRRDADSVLVLTSLYDARTGERLSTNRFKRSWGSVLKLQSDIAADIVEQLHLDLLPDERARLAGRHTVSAEAYDSYLKGRHFFDLRTAASLEQAVLHFRRALAIDSNYARAYAGLADTYSIMAWTGERAPTDLFVLAAQAARRALSLDSTLAEPHVSLGIIHTFNTWDWVAADREFARAISLDSTMAQAWAFRTWPYAVQGRLDRAMAAIQRAHNLDPLSLIINSRIGTMLAYRRDYEGADSVLRATLEIDPFYPVAKVQLARVLSIRGRHEEAVAMLPSDSVRLGSYESGVAGFVLARAGRRDEALATAHALETRPYVPAEGVAAIYAALGDREAAFTWLDRAMETRGVGLIFLTVEPLYESLRGDPRFRELAARIGLGGS